MNAPRLSPFILTRSTSTRSLNASWRSVLAACLTLACSGKPAAEVRATDAPAPPEATSIQLGCEPAFAYAGYRSQLFVATRAQLKQLFDCRHSGLTSERDEEPNPGQCSLEENSIQVVTVPELQHGTLHHFGHVLGAPLLDEDLAAADSAAWPPSTLEYVGATHAPVGTLWRVPSAYRGLILKVHEARLEAQAGDALAAHLLEFTPRLRASDPQAACRSLVALLADLLERAAAESADVYVLTLNGKA